MTLKVTSTPPALAPTLAPSPVKASPTSTDAATATVATPVLQTAASITPPPPAPAASLIPLPPSPAGFSHDLGVLKIGDKNYRMVVSNWPVQTLNKNEKEELFNLFAAQFLQINVEDQELEIRLDPKGPELVSGPKKDQVFKLESPALIELTQTLLQPATITLQNLKLLTAPGTVAEPPVAMQWGHNNCAWVSLLRAYFCTPQIQKALQEAHWNEITHPLNALYNLIQKKDLDKISAQELKQQLITALATLVKKIEAQSPQHADLPRIKDVLDRVTKDAFLDPQEIWSCLVLFLTSSQDLLGNGMTVGLTFENPISSESVSQEIYKQIGNKSSEYIDFELFYKTQQTKAALPLILQNPPQETYVLQSIILHRPGHIISIVRKKDDKGILRNFVCNSHPNGNTVTEISNLQLQEFLKTGQLPKGGSEEQGYRPVQAFYAKLESEKKASPQPPPPPYTSTPPSPVAKPTADQPRQALWERVTNAALSLVLPLPPAE